MKKKLISNRIMNAVVDALVLAGVFKKRFAKFSDGDIKEVRKILQRLSKILTKFKKEHYDEVIDAPLAEFAIFHASSKAKRRKLKK